MAFKPVIADLLLILTAMTCFRCQQEVALPHLPYEERVVIQGIMEPDSVPIVYFNRTVPYLSGITDPALLVIRDASMVITSPGESDQLFPDSVFLPLDCKYSYFYKGNIPVKVNTSYTLLIASGPYTYSATTATSPRPVNIDKVSYTPAFKDLYGEHEGVITYFTDIPGEEHYYRFEMTRLVDRSSRDVTGNSRDLLVPCMEEGESMLFTEVGRSVYHDREQEGKQIKLIIEPALTHTTPVTIYVRIQTIDKAIYDFYDQLDNQKLSQYNPFVEPIFIREGQFGKRAVGYFGSMVRSDSVKFEMPPDD
ncbi:MAG: DUF4249 family protein [Cyclobacteriaceae bacterium]